MNLPNALIIGPQKAGTTWIHYYLEWRGDVCLPKGVKETMFFDRYYKKGMKWYAKHFHPKEGIKRIIEVAPTYFHCPDAPKRIYDTLGYVPLVCTLRNPAERSFSLYLHMRRYGMTTCTDFREAVKRHPVIIESSRYATHLERWIKLFGRELILVLLQEDLAKDPDTYTKKLCAHLELPYIPLPRDLYKRVNPATLPRFYLLAKIGQNIADRLRSAGMYTLINWAKKIGFKSLFFGGNTKNVPKLSPEDRNWILEQLQPEIEELEEILRQDFSQWKK